MALWFSKEVVMLRDKIQKASSEKEELLKRVRDLEDSIQKEYGVTVRNEVTEVNVAFDKTELAIMHAAVCRMMEKPLSTEDVRYYLALRVKIEGLLNSNVKE